MNIQIDLQKIAREFDTSFRESMEIHGVIDKLETETGAHWRPAIEKVRAHLDQIPTEDIPKRTSEIEGKFLIRYTRGQKTFIFVDRFSWFIAFYRFDGSKLEVTGTIPLDSHLSIDPRTATTFTLFSYVPGRQTLFRGYCRLMPGECIELDTGTGIFKQHHTHPFPPKLIEQDHHQDMIAHAHGLFRQSLENRISQLAPTDKLLLPLSGGLDSRYLLGLALELVPASRLLAMSFGPDQSYDLTIGKRLADHHGIQHKAYNLDRSHFSGENLKQTAIGTQCQIGFPLEGPNRIFEDFMQYGRAVISGHLGDGIMGKPARSLPPLSMEDMACQDTFVQSGDRLRKLVSAELVQDSFFYQKTLQETPLLPFEEWWLMSHIPKYTHHCILRVGVNFDFLSPYSDYSVVDFITNLPAAYRIGRRLQIELLQNKFPELAGFPATAYRGASILSSNFGIKLAFVLDYARRKITGIERRANYFDFRQYYKTLLDQELLQRSTARWLSRTDLENLAAHPMGYVHILNLYGLVLMEEFFGISISSD